MRFSLWAMDYALPEKVAAITVREHDGVPIEVGCTMVFPGDVLAQFDCGYDAGVPLLVIDEGREGWWAGRKRRWETGVALPDRTQCHSCRALTCIE